MPRTKASRLLVAGSLLTSATPAFAQQLEHMEASRPDPFIVPIIASALIVVAVIALALRFANQRDRSRQELLARFIDKGQEIPPQLMPQHSAQCEMRRGVMLTDLGVGLGAALYIVSGNWRVAAWSLLPLCLGAASFVNGAFFRRSGPGQ